jgi:GntR family uxuAB operon transcriptional repressor
MDSQVAIHVSVTRNYRVDMTTAPDKDRRFYQTVGQALIERIMAGEFNAVERLPSERELAASYDVGRAVIRDALVMLEVKGIVEVRQGSGIYVTRRAWEAQALKLTDIPPSQITEVMPAAGPFELLQARQWLESHIARLAAANATELDLKAIAEAYEDHQRAPYGEVKEGMDVRFHLSIARATQNAEMVAVVQQLRKGRENNPLWTRLSERIRDPHYRDRWVKDHSNLLDALMRKDPEGAYVAMWNHIENVRAYLQAQMNDGIDFE